VKFRDLRKVLARYDIFWDKRKGKGSHGAFVGPSHKTRLKRAYTLPESQQKKTRQPYLDRLREQFELTPENGIPDDQFI